MYILCDLKGQCLNHDHVVYEYMGAGCSKLRQPMRTIFALIRAQLLLLVFTISRDLSRECHVIKHKTPIVQFPIVQFRKFRDQSSRGLCLNDFEKSAHPNRA